VILHGPIAILQAERSADPLLRLIAAGEKLSNMAYAAGVNGHILSPAPWIAAYREWDDCARAYRDSLASPLPTREEEGR
jgi:hypothetical protein